MKKRSIEIGKRVLSELDWFDQGFTVRPSSPAVEAAQRHLKSEPFIAYVKVEESLDETNWTERTYLICRNDIPLSFDPAEENGCFANRNAPVGRIASIDPKDEITIKLPDTLKRKTLRVIEKDIFVPVKTDAWDATSNKISFGLDDEYVHSLREVVGAKPPKREVVPAVGGLASLEELRKLEEAQELSQRHAGERKLLRQRGIVESIALRDQPILDRSQDEFCRKPLKSQMILSGSPGTGKTTSIIKRVAMKSNSVHLQETEGFTIDEDRLRNWLIFTPNDLLKIYLKEAMNKEELSATDQYVTTWEKERRILGRDVLQFLKIGDKGLFSKTDKVLLRDASSSGTVSAAADFLAYLDREFLSALDDAIDNLASHDIKPSIITKKTYPIAESFRLFGAACRRAQERLNQIVPVGKKRVSLIAVEELSKLSADYQKLRNSVDELINEFVDVWIASNPALFSDLVDYLQTSASTKTEANPEDREAEDDLNEDSANEIDAVQTIADPKLATRAQIRRTIANWSEGSVSGRQIRDKEQRFIWDYMQVSASSTSDLTLVGHLRLALKPRIFRIGNFNTFLREVPRSFQRFRTAEQAKGKNSLYLEDSDDAIKNRRISNEEIDIVIFTMLRLTSMIRRLTEKSSESDLQRDILRRITDQYRTQIAVDEATDFSALQLASIYYLTDPKFRAVTFSGDLMQRVTTTGLGSWNELKALIPTIEQYDLLASYRQTPTLLNIAKKLYENIIGEEPPFNSKYDGKGSFPAPLKYVGTCDDKLAKWLARRVYEIYRLNEEKLPSIAVFVPSEEDIDPTCSILADALNEYSIDVEPCKMGKVLGTGSNVRIFSIEFIKGLEFEGVFYIDIDRAYETHPELVDKYLYVGLTRATTFLGITYRDKLPDSFEFLDGDFVAGDWSSYL